MNNVRRIFFDVSSLRIHLQEGNVYSGIQRLLVNLVSSLYNSGVEVEIYISYISRKSGKIYCARVGGDISCALLDADQAACAILADTDHPKVSNKLRRYGKRRLIYNLHKARFDLMAALGVRRAFRSSGTSLEEWRSLRHSKATKGASFDEVTFSHGDLMLAFDSSWGREYRIAFKGAKESGCRIVTLIYDLIPLKAPELVDAGMTVSFARYIDDVLGYSDEFLAISEFTAMDMRDLLSKAGSSKSVRVLRLVQAPLASGRSTGLVMRSSENSGALAHFPEAMELLEVSSDVRVATSVPYVLCVGTIEGRKNVWRLASAWKKLLDNNTPDLPRLVFAGRYGLHSSSFVEMMRGTGFLSGHACVVEAPSDRDVEYLYRHCLFALMPSLYEGWGLPVGEALSYGKTSVVSNTTSLPEVGSDLVRYCDPLSVDSIADAALALIENPDLRRSFEEKISRATLRDWNDVAQDLRVILAEAG